MRKIGPSPTPDQQRDIALKQARLQEKIDAFQRQAANILRSASDDGDDSWDGTGRETYLGTEFDGIGEKKKIMRGLHLPKSTIKCNYSEIVLPMAVWMQSIFHCTSPHILDKAGAIEMLPKT